MHKFSGLILIEVIVSLFILALLLLGLDGLAVYALKEASYAYHQSIALQQLKSMSERLMLSKGANLAEILADWNQQNQNSLPQGNGRVEGAYPYFKLTITWGNQSIQSCHNDQLRGVGCLHLE